MNKIWSCIKWIVGAIIAIATGLIAGYFVFNKRDVNIKEKAKKAGEKKTDELRKKSADDVISSLPNPDAVNRIIRGDSNRTGSDAKNPRESDGYINRRPGKTVDVFHSDNVGKIHGVDLESDTDDSGDPS